MPYSISYVRGGRRRASCAGVRSHATDDATGIALCGFDGGPTGFESENDDERPSCKRCRRTWDARRLSLAAAPGSTEGSP